MDRASRESKQERINQIDANLPSPDERAQAVWEILRLHAPDLTTWDILCFCVNYVGLVSQENEWLEKDAKQLAKLVYIAHYQAMDQNIPTGLKRNGQSSNKRSENRLDTGPDEKGSSDT